MLSEILETLILDTNFPFKNMEIFYNLLHTNHNFCGKESFINYVDYGRGRRGCQMSILLHLVKWSTKGGGPKISKNLSSWFGLGMTPNSNLFQ